MKKHKTTGTNNICNKVAQKAGFLAPPSWVSRSWYPPSFNADDLAADAIEKLLAKGHSPEEEDFMNHVYDAMKQLRSQMARKHRRQEALLARYRADWEKNYAIS